MNPPDRIYLQWHGDGDPDDLGTPGNEATWSSERVYPGDVEYVRADLHAATEARVKVLTEALKPFADWYERLGEDGIHWQARAAYRRAKELTGGLTDGTAN